MMASLAANNATSPKSSSFFLYSSLVMAATIVAGFSLQLGMGRSSFGSPPIVHAHAIVFMGWVVLYVAQNVFVSRQARSLHRQLGWIGVVWVVAMVVLGTIVTVRMVRAGHAPFFFTPLKFLIFNPISLLAFAGLTAAAIRLRRHTEWHARLHYCAMANLLGPALGRLMPLPLLIPYAYEATFVAMMVFPAAGAIADFRTRRRVHPAWWWGISALVATTLVTEALTNSTAGLALYSQVTAGSSGAMISPLTYPPWPPLA